jgi:addiction module RelE/StbE family toxin
VRRALVPSAAFVRAAKSLAKKRSQAAEAIRGTLARLEEDAFDPRLKTHRLKGEFAGHWSCSAGYDLRIVFEIAELGGQETIHLLDVGTHDEVY